MEFFSKKYRSVCIGIYDHAPVPFRYSRNLILEFDKNIIDFMDNGDATLNIHIHLKNGDGFINIDKNIYDYDNIGEKYYYVIFGSEKVKNIEMIQLSLVNGDDRKISTIFPLIYLNQN